ncbi:MAG: hypothetical protein HFI38_07295 [Lachnospiraceae bacterium]|jgi:metal-responsive CopG/Arc/MetJ family transcriptional regulator|nr:hypothetical protein [Lachnospiraceae bacterium]
MATSKPRYSITVEQELLEQIEDFRFGRRYQTRAQATVALIRLGLEYLKLQDSQNLSNSEKQY